ncbi:DUF421 domain-containing protein [Deinococcus psychrotolerans]|uniref:DUF421 domain-containing protein n=1 Tax=Deinococcus psychrotolerans TaxID=2489213 RepID=A0A3G8YET8_9DEIO|nr:YetF domain-containing protein [Deinococcus psychrotolerans]AZI43493.1 DUF421 domain-containing protein [Deinococcus psychrotolerans]
MSDVKPFDWARLFLGDAPPLFYVEIVVRTLIIFIWLIVLLRSSGRRSLAQLSAIEFAIVIALGSAVGDPMFYPEVPLLHAMLVMALVVGLQQGLAWLIRRRETIETLIEGRPSELVRGGVLQLAELEHAKLSREDVCETLRNQSVRQLGEVQRAYFEQNGQLSLFVHPSGQAPPGLPIVPPWDLEKPEKVVGGEAHAGPVACLSCGSVSRGGVVPGHCPVCGKAQGFTPAVIDPLDAEETGAV